MSSQKVVRCELRRQGSNGGPSVRYVPLEIFGLWEYLMTSKHSFDVMDPKASLWVDMEESPELAYSNAKFDRVTEVTAFIYSRRDDMFSRVCRYFPTEQYTQLKTIFLSHYSGNGEEGDVKPQVREKSGIWIHRTPGQEDRA